jgi:hypothetical protein
MYITTTPAWQYSTARPEAFITKTKRRLKQYDGQVYLNDGDEYEIELFNSTTNPILAKIKLDGNYIPNGGIVLNPGERVFLERFLGSPQKFKFSTYTVDGKNKQVKQAISNNGSVDIEFYKEYVPSYLWSYTTAISTVTLNSTNLNSTTSGTTTGLSYTSETIPCSTQVETGRTEKGSISSQRFVQSNKTFELLSFHNVSWVILPNSQKVLTVDEVNVLYCSNCGAKRKKTSFKFCPHCGTEY